MSDSKSKDPDFEALRFVRVFTPIHVPKPLIEQVRDRNFGVEDWYKYQESICTIQTPNGPVLNPSSLLYVIADQQNKVVGMLWAEINLLEKALVIQTFSMDKEYWSKGRAVTLAAEKAKEILNECKLRKIFWLTRYPKHSERYGFKRSKDILMEYEEEESGTNSDGGHKTASESTADNIGSAELS